MKEPEPPPIATTDHEQIINSLHHLHRESAKQTQLLHNIEYHTSSLNFNLWIVVFFCVIAFIRGCVVSLSQVQ